MSYEEEFESQYNEERRELAELEYSTPLIPIDDEEEILECTCLLNDIDLPCPIHSKLDEEV